MIDHAQETTPLASQGVVQGAILRLDALADQVLNPHEVIKTTMNIFRNPHWIKSSTLFCSIAVVCLGIFLGMTSQAFAQRPPNFVIILADDKG